MEYSIRQLSELAGISTRTLRYYDGIGLLRPAGIRDSGYRYYGEGEVERLQQILFYKERGMRLGQISEIVNGQEFDVMTALTEHLEALEQEQERISCMIYAVKKTIASMKGEAAMSDKERFEAFKKEIVENNEKQYGEETRSKYGDKEMEASNKKLLNMTEEEYRLMKELEGKILESLKQAVNTKQNPEGEAGREIVRLHRKWLSMTWKDFTPEAQKGLVEMYVADERFKQYYDKEVTGCAAFLKAAVNAMKMPEQ